MPFAAEREGKESGEDSRGWGGVGGKETSSRAAGAVPTARSAAGGPVRAGPGAGLGAAGAGRGAEPGGAGQGGQEAATGAQQGTERSPFPTDEEAAGEERSRAGVALPGWSRGEMRRRERLEPARPAGRRGERSAGPTAAAPGEPRRRRLLGRPDTCLLAGTCQSRESGS